MNLLGPREEGEEEGRSLPLTLTAIYVRPHPTNLLFGGKDPYNFTSSFPPQHLGQYLRLPNPGGAFAILSPPHLSFPSS